MTDPKPVTFQVTIDDTTAQGRYVNFANILHNPTEFVIDFGRVVPGRNDVKVLSRVLMTPFHAKQLLRAVQQNIDIYEKNFGEIRAEFPSPQPEGTDTAN